MMISRIGQEMAFRGEGGGDRTHDPRIKSPAPSQNRPTERVLAVRPGRFDRLNRGFAGAIVGAIGIGRHSASQAWDTPILAEFGQSQLDNHAQNGTSRTMVRDTEVQP